MALLPPFGYVLADKQRTGRGPWRMAKGEGASANGSPAKDVMKRSRTPGLQPDTGSDRRTEPSLFTLRLLATSDLHARIMPYDYAADRPLAHAGLARAATVLRAARREALNCLTLDNGDFLEGEPLSELHAIARSKGGARLPHPVITAMNAVGYDAVALGNHEFSYGIPFLRDALADAAFPVICANAVARRGASPTEDTPFRPPVVILERMLRNEKGAGAPIRIGLVGLLPPQIDIWERKHLSGQIETRDIVATAAAWVPELKARGADLVIALCHSGIDQSAPEDRMENAAVPLAGVKGIDVIISGHTHLAFPGPDVPATAEIDPVAGRICGKPAVMAGFWGSHVGVVDLALEERAGAWRLSGATVTTRTARYASPDAEVSVAAAAAHTRALAFVRQPLGATEVPLHTYFAQVTDSAALALIHAAQRDWLSTALRGRPFASLPLLSAASPFKSGDRGGPEHFTDIAEGPFFRGNLYDLYMYPNSIRALMITGATLAEWLERSAARFRTLAPGVVDQPLFDPDVPAYNFDTISGVSYAFDLSAPARYGPHGQLINPAATRLRDLCWQGRPVRPDDRFAIATNNFRASGGGGYPLADRSMVLDEPSRYVADVIRDYIRRQSPVHTPASGNWRLKGLPPGSAAWFDTGPAAATHLAEPGLPRIEPLGPTPDGFLRCRLWF